MRVVVDDWLNINGPIHILVMDSVRWNGGRGGAYMNGKVRQIQMTDEGTLLPDESFEARQKYFLAYVSHEIRTPLS